MYVCMYVCCTYNAPYVVKINLIMNRRCGKKETTTSSQHNQTDKSLDFSWSSFLSCVFLRLSDNIFQIFTDACVKDRSAHRWSRCTGLGEQSLTLLILVVLKVCIRWWGCEDILADRCSMFCEWLEQPCTQCVEQLVASVDLSEQVVYDLSS